MTRYIKWFEELRKKDIPLVGGKCANLGEMISQTKVPVPFGFAITVDAYHYYIEENKLQVEIERILMDLDAHNVGQLIEKGEKVRKLITNAEVPERLREEIVEAYKEVGKRLKIENPHVAVRSSATAEDLPGASFAGQQETYLNVAGIELLLKRVKDCFASLFTNRAISYREDMGFNHSKVALSVGVQKMVRSGIASAGVIFTIDPDSGHSNFVVINGSWGLGEYVVKGKINPDTFLVFKPTLAIIEKNLGTKDLKFVRADGGVENKEVKVPEADRKRFVLNDDEIKKLAEYSIAIENHYKMPMDIEWAKDGDNDKVYILQARPETVHTIKKKDVLEIYALKERGNILTTGEAVGRKIGQGTVSIMEDVSRINEFKPNQVLVTDMTDPDWEPIMKIAAGIVTNRGGRTCHTAIVSRELGIPCVIGTHNATKVMKDGQRVTIDCSEGVGRIFGGTLKFERKEIDIEKIPKTKTKIYVNVGIPEQALSISQLPVDGVGLARLEFIINSYIGVHPLHLIKIGKSELFIDRLASGIAKIAASFYPRPVIVRLSDFKTNEYANLEGGKQYEPEESNPMIGWRGASRYYDSKFLPAFKLECKALKKVRDEFGLTNVKAMIPFCRTPEEGRKVISIMKSEGLQQRKNDFEIWCMAEIPSNVILADEFSHVFDGFSIGSNDLTQLVLGLDRDSEQVAHLFDERDEAVKRMVSQLIKTAHKYDKPVSICGQGPSDFPEFADFLVREGIDSISLNADVVLQTKIDVVAPSEAKLK
jgi:pyruvate,water dikinase